uniref:Major sperm protein n=1 Tax=Rhabditophanes sp. KR3021 TaxID=114890 RepID=A0AC35TSB2_9BILA
MANEKPIAKTAIKDMANRPDEPPFQLKLEPDSKIVFVGAKLDKGTTIVDIKITNTSPDRQTFKIKCTSNEIFRVRPPLGYIEAGEVAVIKVSFTAKSVPESYKHFFAMYHSKSIETKPPRQVWSAAFKAEGVKRLWCCFKKETGESFTAADGKVIAALEKKEEAKK